jgi:NADPH:quinone reductase-like Zn-dependent oxidoreductase
MADGAGDVVAVGERVAEFAVGDAVVSTFFPGWLDGEPNVKGFSTVPGDGVDGYARERVTASANAFTRAPQGWSHAEAATLTTAGLTAWRALVDDARIKAGDVVLVQGTGGVSIFALQFAKLLGATVIATSSSDAKLQRAKKLGADHVINYRQDPSWGVTAGKLTGGRGVDAVLDVGGPATLEQSLRAARVGGHIALIGVLGGFQMELPIMPILSKQVQLHGLMVGNRRQQQDMVRAIDANGLRPVLDRQFNLEEIVPAFQYQATNQHFGKIVLNL